MWMEMGYMAFRVAVNQHVSKMMLEIAEGVVDGWTWRAIQILYCCAETVANAAGTLRLRHYELSP